MGTEPHWVGRGKGTLWPCTLRSSAGSCLVTGLPGDSRLQPRSGDDGVREERVAVECLLDCSVEVALIFFPHSSASSLSTGRHPHHVLGTPEAPLTVSSVLCPHRLATLQVAQADCRASRRWRGSDLAHLPLGRRAENSGPFGRGSPVLGPCFFFPRSYTHGPSSPNGHSHQLPNLHNLSTRGIQPSPHAE